MKPVKIVVLILFILLVSLSCTKEPEKEEAKWDLTICDTDYFYQMISVADDQTFYIYGYKLNDNNTGLINTLIQSENRGNTWQTLAITKPMLQTTPWTSLSFTDRHTGLLVAGSMLFKTIDSGLNWRKVESETGQFHRIIKNNGRYFAFGNSPFKTSDDHGEQWSTNQCQPTQVSSMAFIDDHSGFASSIEGLYMTRNNGTDWELVSQTQGAFKEISFADQDHGIAIRLKSLGPHAMPDTHVYITNDGGKSWSDIMLKETTDAGQDTNTSLLYVRPGLAYIGCVNAIYKGPGDDNNWLKDYDGTVYGGGLWVRSIRKSQGLAIACGWGGSILMKKAEK